MPDAKAKKRQRQESDDEESRCTVSDNERTIGIALTATVHVSALHTFC